jgi:ABC-type polysaccharide/polyol phosphate export permease
VPYPLFAFVGMMLWTLFSGGVDSATTSLVTNSSLSPRFTSRAWQHRWRASSAAGGLRCLAVLFAVFLVVSGRLPGVQVIFLLLAALWAVVLAFAVGLSLATVQVRFRDAHHGLNLLMQLWLYASPVAYPSSLVPPDWRWVYALNPWLGCWTPPGGRCSARPRPVWTFLPVSR